LFQVQEVHHQDMEVPQYMEARLKGHLHHMSIQLFSNKEVAHHTRVLHIKVPHLHMGRHMVMAHLQHLR
jgi:hypothetical protein